MDVLTVVFTGLIIFEGSGNVHLVRAEHHKMEVTINEATYAVTKSVEFEGLVPGDVTATAGFGLLDLHSILAPKPLSIDSDPDRVISFRLAGGMTAPVGSYARCSANGRPVLSWQGLQWKVSAPSGAVLRIDGKPYSIDNRTKIMVSNDYTGTDDAPHLSMYENALKEKGHLSFHELACEAPYPPLDQKGQARLMKNNPITCPPVQLP